MNIEPKWSLEEIPSIHFLAGGQSYELTSWAWITASDVGCLALFEAMDYQTKENGPVWIFGSPLFYEPLGPKKRALLRCLRYVVGFDQEQKQVPRRHLGPV